MDDATATKLLNTFRYDTTTGKIFWENPHFPSMKGSRADVLHIRDGYTRIHFEGKHYQAHRVAWLFHYKKWPTLALDHINGNKTDNRIENLRETTTRDNNCNQECHRQGKIPGIYESKWGYKAKFRKDGKRIDSSYFPKIEQAIQAYIRLRKREGVPVLPGDIFMQAVEQYRKEHPLTL